MSIFKGSKEKRKKLFETIKGMSKKKKIAIIGVGISMIGLGILGYDSQYNKRIAEAIDIEGDEYNMVMPVDTKVGIKLVPEGSLVIINDLISTLIDEEKKISISALSEDGEYITGDVACKYLKKVGKVSLNKLEKYNRIAFVSGEDVSFKIDPNLGDVEGNIISNIPENIQVLKSEKKEINDEANWYQILYIDDEGNIKEVYGKQQNLIENTLEREQRENDSYDFAENNVNENTIQDSREVNQNKVVKEISDIKMIVNTEFDEVNFRKDNVIDENNIILQIPNGAIVYALSDQTEENEYATWREIKYVDPKTNEEYIGWISNEFLKEYDLIPKIVNTDEIGGISLKLRKTPGGDIIDDIENGSKLNIEFENVINMEIEGQDRYIYVTLEDGKSGYVAYDYLEDDDSIISQKLPTEETKLKALSNYNISKNGYVVGIDISEAISPKQLEEILKSNTAIPNQLTSLNHPETMDTSGIAGKNNYVYIKIGSSSIDKDGKIFSQDNINYFRELARVCEKYGVPYGFYYYSTCVTEEEAKREAAYFNEAMNLLDDREYNFLPPVIDFELFSNSEEDRQYGQGDLTDCKALLAKLISEEYGNVILYTSGYLISDNSSDKQIDWNRFNQIVGEKNKGFWLPALIDSKVGEYQSVSKRDREYFIPIMQSSGKSYFEQIITDTSTKASGDQLIDINIMDENTYQKLIEEQYLEITKENLQEQDIEEFER